MKLVPDDTLSRREFLRRSGRWLALAGLGWLALALAARQATACPARSPCQHCPQNRDCDLPKAQVARGEAAPAAKATPEVSHETP